MPIKIVIYLLAAILFLGFVVTIRSHLIARRALRKRIIPLLEENNYIFTKYKLVRIFEKTGFKNKTQFVALHFTNGSPMSDYFIRVFYSKNGMCFENFVRIRTLFGFIRKIEFLHKIDK
jgi:hypothetical protein